MPAQRKYPDELRERAVKMVLEIRAREGKGHGELARVGRQLGCSILRLCVAGEAGGNRRRDAAGHQRR
jgi:transposase-like protein